MKTQFRKITKLRITFFIWTVLCTALNIILLRLTAFFDLPIYLDTAGTILMAFAWGSLPALLVAVLTNLIYGFFIPDSICYALIGVFVAIRASAFISKEKKDYKGLLCFILDMSLISGAMGACFQWLLLGKPQLGYVEETAKMMAGYDKSAYIISSFIMVIALNLIDKTVAAFIAYYLLKLVPRESRLNMWNSRWKQTPLSRKEVKDISQGIRKGTTSIMVKVVVILMIVSVFTSIVLGVVSTRVNYDEDKERGRAMSMDIARFISSNVETRYLEKFLNSGKEVVEYKDVKYAQYNSILRSLIESMPMVKQITIYGVRDDKFYEIINTDDRFQKRGRVGARLGEEESKELAQLIRSEDAKVREGLGDYGYDITYLEEVENTGSNGLQFYISAKVVMDNYGLFLHRYAVKMMLVFSGFFVLILVCGFWMASHNLVYPLSALGNRIDDFMKAIEDQDELDESVRNLERVDIRTNDELERLYNSICQMANTTAEQMRSIMVLARSNEKMQSGLVATMADIVESQNIDSKAHIQKTTAYVRIILEGLKRKGYYSEKLTLKYMNDVEMSTPLYDIGKIKIPDSILNKPDALTAEEFEIMKTHTTEGGKILDNTISSIKGENYLKEARNMAAYHHEHWDGTGYPEGLHGEVIPLSARIMAIADVFDAVTSLRVYKSASTYEDALDVIVEGSGTRFDPKCVEAFVDSFSEVKSVLRQYS